MKFRKAFRYSLWVLLVCSLLMAITFLPGMGDLLESQRWRWLIDAFGGVVGICAALAGSFFWIGMLIHCVMTKSLDKLPKLLWIFAMLFANLIAALVYYFSVYIAEDRTSHV